MIRINLVLFLVLIVVALSLVTSQYKTRVLRSELESQNSMSHAFATAKGQLQLEQSTLAMHSKLERYAHKQLTMSVPDMKRIQVIELEGSR